LFEALLPYGFGLSVESQIFHLPGFGACSAFFCKFVVTLPFDAIQCERAITPAII